MQRTISIVDLPNIKLNWFIEMTMSLINLSSINLFETFHNVIEEFKTFITSAPVDIIFIFPQWHNIMASCLEDDARQPRTHNDTFLLWISTSVQVCHMDPLSFRSS